MKENLKMVRLSEEGEFKNGKRNGQGKEYYFDGELMYEGEFNNGFIYR